MEGKIEGVNNSGDLINDQVKHNASFQAAVIEKLRVRESGRAAEVVRRQEELEQNNNPQESVSAFLTEFHTRYTLLESTLESLATLEPDEAKENLDMLLKGLQTIEDCISSASYYLPQYELRQCSLLSAALRERFDAVLAAFKPRKKFSFNKKPSKLDFIKEENLSRKTSSASLHSKQGASRCISNHTDKTIIERDTQGADWTLSKLSNCKIYLLGVLQALYIHQLDNCVVYVGPVGGAAYIEDVKGCVMYIASRQVRIHSAFDSTFYLRTLSQPIIEHSSRLNFAPYTPLYEYTTCEDDLASQGLIDDGQWKAVKDFGWLKADASPNWKVLSIENRLPPPAI